MSSQARAAKEAMLSELERIRADYLADARDVAWHLARGQAWVTVDDVREVCPPPEGIDPRVMGAIFRGPTWIAGSWVESERVECHGRPIREFRKFRMDDD